MSMYHTDMYFQVVEKVVTKLISVYHNSINTHTHKGVSGSDKTEETESSNQICIRPYLV